MTGKTATVQLDQVASKNKKKSFNNLLKRIVEFKGWEFVFKVLLFGFCLWGVHSLSIIYIFHTSPEFADIPKFSIYDFKISFFFAFCFFLYKTFCEWFFFNMIMRNLNPEKFPTEEDKRERAKKGCKWVMSIIYYTCSTLTAWYLFREEYFFPKMLLGEGECSAIFKHTPAAPSIPNGVMFYMVQFGCHLHTLIDHVIFKWKDPKFWEMFLHHGIAVFLIFFSYMTNEISVGILVLFTHDPGDIFLDLVRFYNDLTNKNQALLGCFYAGFIFVWVFFRLYAFPACIVQSAYIKLREKEDWGLLYSPYWYLFCMLTALVLLHVYWFFFILRVAINLVMKRKEPNIYDRKKN
jgi:hypothetical protein